MDEREATESLIVNILKPLLRITSVYILYQRELSQESPECCMAALYSKCQIPEISKNVPLNPKEMHSSVTLLPHFFYAY